MMGWNLPAGCRAYDTGGPDRCECGARLNDLASDARGMCWDCAGRERDRITCADCGASVESFEASWDEVLEGYVCDDCEQPAREKGT